MADEANITSNLRITKDNLEYSSQPQSFTADVSGTMGPIPGGLIVDTDGVDVEFTGLTTPALCRIMNLDSTNYVEYGIWDPENDTFFPLGEVLAGETYVLRLSRNLQEQFGTGTGTTGDDTNRLHLRANTANCNVVVEAFEA